MKKIGTPTEKWSKDMNRLFSQEYTGKSNKNIYEQMLKLISSQRRANLYKLWLHTHPIGKN